MHDQTDEEQRISEEASNLLSQLLDNLKSKGFLRKTKPDERRRLLSVFDTTGRFQDAFNIMTKQYGQEKFTEFKRKTGLSEETLIYSFLSQVFSTLLICYETPIKLPLVFFSNKKSGITKKMTLGSVLKKLEIISPSFVSGLNAMINKDLRNAICHGTFWIEQDGLHYAENGYLEEVKVQTYKELQKEMRRVSIIGKAFVHVIKQKASSGYL
jgi:uncharacterized protein YutE (UPF0331/DUF86 family)